MHYIWHNRDARLGAFLGVMAMMMLFAAAGLGYWLGRSQRHPYWALDLKQVSTAASGTNMAVATGAVSDEAEGVFFLDYLTGDLQCLVYYPRSGAFGARYYTNVQAQMPGSGKNAQYLMVTGSAITSRASSNLKPANCLVYVTDVNSGTFAAYTVPWSKTAESSSQTQLGSLVCVGGGPIRNYQLTEPAKKPAAAVPAAKDPAAGVLKPGVGAGKPAQGKPGKPDANNADPAGNAIDPDKPADAQPKGIKRKNM